METSSAGESRAGWILAGGRSSRMGTDKALIEFEGRPLAFRTAEVVSKVCGNVTLIGAADRYRHLGLRVVPDGYPGQGPLAGIEAALSSTTAEENLVVACDMPALDAATLEALFATLDADSDCAVPQYADGTPEPLCAVFRRRCHALVREALESGIRKVTDALRHLESHGFAIRYLRVTTNEAFANLNTPGELSRYRAERRNG